MKILFTQNRVTPTQTYLQGEVYELPDKDATHWINDGVASKAAKEPVEAKAIDSPPRDKAMKKRSTKRKTKRS